MKYIIYIFLLPTLLLLTACSSSDDTVYILGSDDCVSISFNMVTGGTITSSRADSQGHGETDSEFREFEDGINMADFGIFIFAKIAGSSSEEKLVYKLTNLLGSDDARINITGGYGNYFVNLMIRRDDLKDVLDGYELSFNGSAIISFRILILANCSTSTTNVNAMWDAIDGRTYNAVMMQLAQWNFPMSDIYNAEGGTRADDLYGKNNTHCPMFGTNVFATTESALFYSNSTDRIYLGAVNLLRALAKVKVVDNIPNKDNQGYPCISTAEIISSQTHVWTLPANAVNYQDGEQVHTPNIYQDNTNLTPEATYKLGTIPESWTITPASQRTGDVFIGFIPEQKIAHPNNNFDQGMPMFHLTITNRKADTTLETYDYYVPMTSYNGVNFSFGDNILRNHIYTLSVNDFGANLDIRVDLVPYRSCVLEPYFGLERD